MHSLCEVKWAAWISSSAADREFLCRSYTASDRGLSNSYAREAFYVALSRNVFMLDLVLLGGGFLLLALLLGYEILARRL